MSDLIVTDIIALAGKTPPYSPAEAIGVIKAILRQRKENHEKLMGIAVACLNALQLTKLQLTDQQQTVTKNLTPRNKKGQFIGS